ncbi:MAG: hypothetical protein ACRD6W_06170 [Nitrososphaerales archaeon]
MHELVDQIPDDAVDAAGFFLRRVRDRDVDPEQAWVWTDDWQDQLRGSLADLEARRTNKFASDDEFIASL